MSATCPDCGGSGWYYCPNPERCYSPRHDNASERHRCQCADEAEELRGDVERDRDKDERAEARGRG